MEREKIFFELMETLYELSRQISAYESIPRKYGTDDDLYMVEAHTINRIGDLGQTSTTELARLTNKTKGAISQMVDKLIKKDLVVKYKNPSNQREVIIELTEKGKIVYEYHRQLDLKEYSLILKKLDKFTTQDFKNFISISKAILNNSDKD